MNQTDTDRKGASGQDHGNAGGKALQAIGSWRQSFDGQELSRLLHEVSDVQMRIIKLIDGLWNELRSLASESQKTADEIRETARRLEQALAAASASARPGQAADGASSRQSPAEDRAGSTQGGARKLLGRRRSRSLRLGTPEDPRARVPEAPASGDPEAPGPFRPALGEQGAATPGAYQRTTPTASRSAEDEGITQELVDELRYLVVEAQRIFDLLSRR